MLVGEWSAGREMLSRKSIWSMGTGKFKGPELSLFRKWQRYQLGHRTEGWERERPDQCEDLGFYSCIYSTNHVNMPLFLLAEKLHFPDPAPPHIVNNWRLIWIREATVFTSKWPSDRFQLSVTTIALPVPMWGDLTNLIQSTVEKDNSAE